MRELELLAAFVHGALAFGHALGLVYNVRRRQWVDAAAHAAALIYDTRATVKHARDVGE